MTRIQALYILCTYSMAHEIKGKHEQKCVNYTSTDNVIVMLYKNQWENVMQRV